MKDSPVICRNCKTSLCRNTLYVLNSLKITIVKQFNIETFYTLKGRTIEDNFAVIKWLIFYDRENNNFVSMD